MFNRLITEIVRRKFTRIMRFKEDKRPEIPRGDILPRLLYLHIPFCERLCPYCSFHRVTFQESLCRRYFAALRKEILLYKEEGYSFRGVYVGGGTPTVMIDELEETLNLVGECFPIREISVETNPNHLTAGYLAALKRAGVGRLSVGIQSFDDGLLKAMDRYEKYGSGEAIAERLQEALGIFDTLNADMIFNFPSQNLTMLNRDLDILMNMEIDQITYYPLMVSDSTRQLVKSAFGRVDYGTEEILYRQIIKRLLPTYSFSSAWCFSRKESASIIDEYIVDYDEYAGLGSGSIGYLKGTTYANTFDIPRYIDEINRGKAPLWASRDFNLKEKMRYDFLMKLFTTKMKAQSLPRKYGIMFYLLLWPDILSFFLMGGIRYRGGCLYLTKRGCYLWVIMMREFFIAVNNFRDFCRNNVVS